VPVLAGFLKKALSQQPDLIELVPFQNPQASGPSEHGTGCELDLSGATSDPGKLRAIVQIIRPFFTQDDYRVAGLADCGDLIYRTRPGPARARFSTCKPTAAPF
jgi:hypothetical protein